MELALKLLSLSRKELSVKEAMEIIRGVSRLNEVAVQALALGEERGIIERDKDRLYILSPESFGSEVIKRECSASCRRCGKRITSCHYIVIEGEELGPFGSECVKFLSP